MNTTAKINELIRRIMARRATGGVYYINGSDNLPAPLTKEEEEHLLCQAVGYGSGIPGGAVGFEYDILYQF